MKRLFDPLLIALFALLFLTTFSASGQTTPKNPTIPPDTDGKVPIVNKCEPDGNPKWNMDGSVWTGRYQYQTIRDSSGNVKEIRGTIYLNECRMSSYSEEDKQVILEHELAHSRGWNHGEGTPETNPAYYPY
jgi:hypothetical protein